jgi:hypothetical protein
MISDLLIRTGLVAGALGVVSWLAPTSTSAQQCPPPLERVHPFGYGQLAAAWDPTRELWIAVLSSSRSGSSLVGWSSRNGLDWQRLPEETQAPAGYPLGAIYDRENQRVIIGLVAGRRAEFDGQHWILSDAEPGVPAWPWTDDPSSGRLFAANSAGVWVREGGVWHRLDTANMRSASIAYDASRDAIVGFEHEWSGGVWRALPPAPESSTARALAYDPARRLVVFVRESPGRHAADAWGWDGSTWSLIARGERRSPQEFDVLAAGPTGTLALVSLGLHFGEYLEFRELSDRWRYVLGTPPPANNYPALTYDPSREVTLAVLGDTARPEIWEYDGSWRHTQTGPPSMSLTRALAFDEARGRALSIGYSSLDGSSKLVTHERIGGEWVLAGVQPWNAVRIDSFCYDASRRAVVGWSSSGGAITLAAWNGAEWESLGVGAPAIPGELAFDAGRNRLVRIATNLSVSELVGSDWNTPSQPVRHNARTIWAGYAASIGRVVALVSFEADEGQHVLAWDGTSWSELGLGVSLPRAHPGVAFDQRRQMFVMWGGAVIPDNQPRRTCWEFGVRSPIVVHEAPSVLQPCGTTAIRLSIGQSVPGVSYQWFGRAWNQVWTPIAGATDATVELPASSLATTGVFRCEILVPCGMTTSLAVSRTPRCPADLDDGSGTGSCDDRVTIDDLLFFLRVFAEGGAPADLTGDGVTIRADGGVTIDDLALFLARYLGGC